MCLRSGFFSMDLLSVVVVGFVRSHYSRTLVQIQCVSRRVCIDSKLCLSSTMFTVRRIMNSILFLKIQLPLDNSFGHEKTEPTTEKKCIRWNLVRFHFELHLFASSVRLAKKKKKNEMIIRMFAQPILAPLWHTLSRKRVRKKKSIGKIFSPKTNKPMKYSNFSVFHWHFIANRFNFQTHRFTANANKSTHSMYRCAYIFSSACDAHYSSQY